MALTSFYVTRATQPHLPTLADTLAPLLAVANAGGFHLRYQAGQVVIEQASFAGVNLTSVDAAVTAAPEHSDALDAQTEADAIPLLMRAALLTMLDLVNVERARHSAATVTQSAYVTAVKAKVDAL